MAARFAPQHYTNLRLLPASPCSRFSGLRSVFSHDAGLTRGWGERRGAGDALAEIDAVDGSVENRNRRARRGRAAQSPHPVPMRDPQLRGHKPNRTLTRTDSVTRCHTAADALHFIFNIPPSPTVRRQSAIFDIGGARPPWVCDLRQTSQYTAPPHPREPRPRPRARGDQSDESRSCSVAIV